MLLRNYPKILAVDPEGCGCTECIVGEYVPLDQFMLYGAVGDVVALAKGEIGNNTYTHDLKYLVSCIIRGSGDQYVNALDVDTFFSDGGYNGRGTTIQAVDPRGCGCTECLTGVYMPLDAFMGVATVGDIMALNSEDISNNTYMSLGELLIEVVRYSNNTEVNDLASKFRIV